MTEPEKWGNPWIAWGPMLAVIVGWALIFHLWDHSYVAWLPVLGFAVAWTVAWDVTAYLRGWEMMTTEFREGLENHPVGGPALCGLTWAAMMFLLVHWIAPAKPWGAALLIGACWGLMNGLMYHFEFSSQRGKLP